MGYVGSQEGSNFHTQTTPPFPIIPFFPFLDLHLDDQATGSITYFHGHHSPQGGCHRNQNPSHTKQGSLYYQPQQRITIVESRKTTIHLHLMPPEKIPQLSSTFFSWFLLKKMPRNSRKHFCHVFLGSKKSPPTFFSNPVRFSVSILSKKSGGKTNWSKNRGHSIINPNNAL